MGYENDPYRDEDGEPLMDFDEEYQSDQEPQGDNLVLDDDSWRRRERSPTPVFNESDLKSKPRKRLVKKSGGGADAADDVPDFGLGDEDVDEPADFVRDDSDGEDMAREGKGKKFVMKDKKKDKKLRLDRREKSGGGGVGSGSKFKVKKRGRDADGDKEVKEMWDTIAGGDSEV